MAELLRGGARLVTLTGPGGSGKTRLAVEVASELVPDFKAGVFWVRLATLRDPALVPEAVAQTLGAGDDLAEHIRERELLLVLDNLEQVIGAAPELAALIEACPNLRLLVTSREVLRVRGEREYAVPPLADPEAVELFCERSQLGASDEIAQLCRRLDSLPLAVELAAARTSVLSPRQILERLGQRLDLLAGGRDADARQRTLRATIEWSHGLLDEREQRLFARFAVFAGAGALTAAEAVVDADLDVLQSLVEKSLVRRTDERFWMLETIRDFALERLEATDEAEDVRRRHADHYVSLAQEAEPSILGISPVAWLDRLELEHDNLRAALDWLEAAGSTRRALLLGGTVWEFWCLRGHAAEGWRRLERLLALDERPTRERAKALTGSAHLAAQVPEGAPLRMRRCRDALALHREVGDEWSTAFAEFELATAFPLAGDFAEGRPLLEQSVERMRELGDEHRALQAVRALAWCNLELGERKRAKELSEELLVGARAAGDRNLEAPALGSVALFASDEGRPGEAVRLLEEAYRLDLEVGDPLEIPLDLIRMARALALADRADAAVQLLALAWSLLDTGGIVVPADVVRYSEEAETRSTEQLGDSAFAAAWDRGRRLSTDDAVALAVASI